MLLFSIKHTFHKTISWRVQTPPLWAIFSSHYSKQCCRHVLHTPTYRETCGRCLMCGLYTGTFASDATAVKGAGPFISSHTSVPAAWRQKSRVVLENPLILQQGMMGRERENRRLGKDLCREKIRNPYQPYCAASTLGSWMKQLSNLKHTIAIILQYTDCCFLNTAKSRERVNAKQWKRVSKKNPSGPKQYDNAEGAHCWGLPVHGPECRCWQSSVHHKGSWWKWKCVKMLTKRSTEQGICWASMCHLERQKGLWSSGGEFYTATVKISTALMSLPLQFSQNDQNRYYLYKRRSLVIGWECRGTSCNGAGLQDCPLNWSSAAVSKELFVTVGES